MSYGGNLEIPGGLEPPTTSLEGKCSAAELRDLGTSGRNRTYRPSRYERAVLPLNYAGILKLVSVAGFEPATSCVRGMRSTKLSYTLALERVGGIEPRVSALATPCSAIELHPQLAEGVGFEPTAPLARCAVLRTRCDKPLCHPSLSWRTVRDSNARNLAVLSPSKRAPSASQPTVRNLVPTVGFEPTTSAV